MNALSTTMKPLLTVPIQTSDLDQIGDQLRKNLQEVSAYEIWIDHLKKRELTPDNVRTAVRKWKKMTSKKLVVVCKNFSEKGRFRGSRKEKLELLSAAAQGGADFIDLSIHTGKKVIEEFLHRKKKTKLILSFHDFEKTPKSSRLQEMVRQMEHLKADIIKICTAVNSLEDNQRLIDLTLQLTQRKKKHIILGMGEKGIVTRILGQKLGNELHFVSLGSKTAAGQLTLEQAIAFQTVLQ